MSRTFGVMALSARVLSTTHGSLFSWSWVKYSCFAEAAELPDSKRLIFAFFHSFCDWPKAERMITVDWVVCDC